ncbi:MAG TPA: RES family NAD+ phosphorylase [Burkholderiaceae bacterium]
MTCGLPAPGPAEDFTVRAVTPQDVPVWYHVYNDAAYPTTATTFAEGWGDTRFAPIRQADGTPVHTYYVASSREAAYMESVLHNVSLSPPGVFETASLRHFHLVKLQFETSLDFVSLHTLDLPRLRLTRAQLIDSLTDCYPETRAWSQAAHLQRPASQAVGYGSRRDDSGRCLMLFKQRLADPPFTVLEEHCLANPPLRKEVLALVRSLGVREI